MVTALLVASERTAGFVRVSQHVLEVLDRVRIPIQCALTSATMAATANAKSTSSDAALSTAATACRIKALAPPPSSLKRLKQGQVLEPVKLQRISVETGERVARVVRIGPTAEVLALLPVAGVPPRVRPRALARPGRRLFRMARRHAKIALSDLDRASSVAGYLIQAERGGRNERRRCGYPTRDALVSRSRSAACALGPPAAF